jgi:O-6-methylguanine DNA methyltransferase
MWAMTAQTATASLMSPIGLIILGAEGDQLVSVRIDPEGEGRQHDPVSSQRGEALRSGIAAVPYGETMTYGRLAEQLGSAPRAVGQACKRNPFPILIPCHRVTSTTGPEYYSGGAGASTKAWLLDFEQGHTPWKRTRLL